MPAPNDAAGTNGQWGHLVMRWSDWLAYLPFFRTRQALTDTARRLHESKRDQGALRARAEALERRLAVEKRQALRLKRRLSARRSTFDDRRLLVFEHVPKTAGTTFRRAYLAAALLPEQRWILGGGETNARDRERFLALSPGRRARIRVVAGHNAGALRQHLCGARFVTVVRDPVARAVSSYLHARFHHAEAPLWPDVAARGLSLAQFADRYLPANGQSRILLGDDCHELDEQEMRRRLRSRYALVGYTEAFDQFVYVLHVTERLPLCLYGNRLVRAERRNYVPSDTDLAEVRRSQQIDAVLHRIVKEEFDQRIAALSDAERDRMRRFLEALRVYREA